jgi:ATP-dependent DNA helicase RecQ
MILEYFGDETEVNHCACDVCRHGREPAVAISPGAALPEETVTLVRQILSAIARCKKQFGVGAVAEMLAGTRNERTQRWRLDELSTFGLLKTYPVKRIIAMLHRVLESGLARQRDPDGAKFRPVVELTTPGVAVMRGEQPPPAALSDLLPRNPPARPATGERKEVIDEALDADAQTRFERLRQLRAQIARTRGLPAYVVCHDTTLKQIASQSPADEISLGRIKGMGPYKIKMYGQAFLDALKSD